MSVNLIYDKIETNVLPLIKEIKTSLKDAKTYNDETRKKLRSGYVGQDYINGLSSKISDYENDLADLIQKLNDKIAEVNTIEKNTVPNSSDTIENSNEENVLLDFLASTGATVLVGSTSIASGVLKLGEHVIDGAFWLGGNGLSLIASPFSKNFSDDVANATAAVIAIDAVGELNKYYYEDTYFGNLVNEKSYLKYDSKISKGIQDATEVVTEVVAATALTIATGGLAAPISAGIVISTGTVSGIGESAENRYQGAILNGEGVSSRDDALKIVLDGLGTGLNWYGMGKLGQGAVSAFNAIKEIGVANIKNSAIAGLKEMVAKGPIQTLKDVGTGAVNLAKGVLSKESLAMAFRGAMTDVDTWIDSGSVVAHHITSAINGEEFDAGAFLKELGLAFGLNVAFRGLTNYVSGTKIVDDVASDDPWGWEKIKGESSVDSVLTVTVTEDLFSDDDPWRWGKVEKTMESSVDSVLSVADDDPLGKTGARIVEKYRSILLSYSEELGIEPTELLTILDDKVEELVTTSDFACRRSLSSLERMLDTDGLMKNQFETGTSGGYLGKELRETVEFEVLGVSLDTPIADRPVYGMCVPNVTQTSAEELKKYIEYGPGGWYGNGDGCILVLDKSKVIDNTTITLGDSLDYKQYVLGVPATKPTFTGAYDSFTLHAHSVDDLKTSGLVDLFSTSDRYMEIQLHGQASHSINNVKEVIFTSKKPSEDLIKKLNAAGIEWRILE